MTNRYVTSYVQCILQIYDNFTLKIHIKLLLHTSLPLLDNSYKTLISYHLQHEKLYVTVNIMDNKIKVVQYRIKLHYFVIINKLFV